MVYQSLLVIQCQIHIYQMYMICKHILLITFLNESELILFTYHAIELLRNSYNLTSVICLQMFRWINIYDL